MSRDSAFRAELARRRREHELATLDWGDVDVEALADALAIRVSAASCRPRTPTSRRTAARFACSTVIRLGKPIRKHRDEILAAIRLGINQGRTEALNNKARLITRRACGFHSAKAALALVMLTCGPITLHLPHELHTL
jgi:hypothetical protein